MNPVEKGSLAIKQLKDKIKLKKLRPEYVRVTAEEEPREVMLVNKDAQIDQFLEEEDININKVRSQLANKLLQISDNESMELMLDALESKLSHYDLAFLNGVWNAVLQKMKKNFDSGTSRDLVIDFIIENLYEMQINSSKSDMNRKNDEIELLEKKIEDAYDEWNDYVNNYNKRIVELRKMKDTKGKAKYDIKSDGEGFAKIYNAGKTTIAKNEQKKLDKLDDIYKLQKEQITNMIKELSNKGMKKTVIISKIKNEDYKQFLVNDILPASNISGDGYKKQFKKRFKKLLPNSVLNKRKLFF